MHNRGSPAGCGKTQLLLIQIQIPQWHRSSSKTRAYTITRYQNNLYIALKKSVVL